MTVPLRFKAVFRLQPTMARAIGRRRAVPARRCMSSQLRPYKIHIGASFAGKPHEFRTQFRKPQEDFPAGSDIAKWRKETLSFPKSVPFTDTGEDFFYVQPMRNQSGISFGIADGVGGWVDSGVDPSLFSQALMYHAHRYAESAWAGEPEVDPLQNYEERQEVEGWELTPKECLELAHGGVLREKTVKAGSSTACIVNINASSGVLRSANLGDSGFSILRSSSVLFQQPPQQHFFNCPKQLAKLPIGTKKYDLAFVDSPQDADVYETKLRDGDVIVVYTDGYSDNVFPSELLQLHALVRKSTKSEESEAQDLADRMVLYARQCMLKQNRVSPFEKAATREGLHFRGGKVDDVTVVVAIVRESI